LPKIIAAKYKEYDALSRPTKKIETTTQIQAKVIQPPHFASIQTTPRKVTTKVDNTLISPCRQVSYPVSPTPQALRVRLGPTPQRNGQVLGLFDNDFQTPSRTRQALNDIHSNVIATPSGADKSCHDDKFDNENDLQRFGRTPTSSGKRYMLDIFATPLKRKREECLGSPIVESKHEDHTPKFLRRTTLDFRSQVGLGNATNTTSSTRQKQPLVRSLSAIIRGLKDQIEEQADEELDLLRELEQAEVTNPKSGGTTLPQPIEKSATHDEREMPLGPDRAAESDGEDEGDDLALAGADGQPRKVWKKKGLKRQTRRVNSKSKTVPSQVLTILHAISATSSTSRLEPSCKNGAKYWSN